MLRENHQFGRYTCPYHSVRYLESSRYKWLWRVGGLLSRHFSPYTFSETTVYELYS